MSSNGIITMWALGLMVLCIPLTLIGWALQDIQRTLAKLPEAMNTKREIILPPKEEARQGDVQFHIPSSLYGDRS